MKRKLAAFFLLSLMILGGCTTPSDAPSIQSPEPVRRNADTPPELVGEPEMMQLVVDGKETVFASGTSEYAEILEFLQGRFPDALQEAQQAVLWADQNGFNWELMCEQFDFLLLTYSTPQVVDLNCLSADNPAVPQITFEQMLFPLTELHGILCVDTEETGPRCYGPLDKASAALLREYADLPDDRTDASSAPSMVPSESESSHPEEPDISHLTFRGETVTDIYALHAHRHTTWRYLGQDAYPGFDESRMMELLEQMPEDTELTVNASRSFIVFTETGRHYIYTDPDQTPQELLDAWETIALSQGRECNIHWLTHMTTSKITGVEYSMMEAMGTVTDRESIAEISCFLKEELLLDGEAGIEVFDGAANPATVGSLYTVRIQFDSGVSYFIMGYGDYGETDVGGSSIWIYTSDLDQTRQYQLIEGCAGELRRFFADHF